MENEKEKTVLKDLEIENMREFLLENQDIKLENLPKYEDLIQPKEQPKLENMQEMNTLPFLQPKPKPKEEEVQQKTPQQKRFKIAVSCFAVIGVLLASLVAINGVALAMLGKDIKDNQKDINTLTEEVTDLQQNLELDDSLTGSAEEVGYKLALPRNYPDNTADLTWFDKLSIFLMKLFG